MTAFILDSQNLPFVIALTIMLMIALLEGIMTAVGFGMSNMIDSFLPDVDLDADLDVDLDADLDADLDHPAITHAGVLTKTLGWLRIGQVPFLVILIVFLTLFGLGGLFVQYAVSSVTGSLLPALIASAVTLAICLPPLRFLTGIVAKIMPKDQTEVVSEKSFIGKIAVVTLGVAVKHRPAQAKLKDRFGTTHYIMIEPDEDDERFVQGDQVLIVRQAGSGYAAIRNLSAVLNET